MYKKVSTDMNFKLREEAMIKFWKSLNLQEKMMNLRKGQKHFTIFDGPPTANGKPHIGHVLTRTIKDVIPRYKRMKGFDVEFKAGWDTHGLPVELEVEKMLGINGKPQIEAYGIESFIKQCKESVWKYKDQWEKISERMAYSADMKDPYVTYDNNYIESEWWAIKKIAEQGLLYKGHKIVPYCPRCGTALASHEVAQGYKDIKENTVYVRFAVKNELNTYFIAWTTTPWTLPSNLALCVNPDSVYVLVDFKPAVETEYDLSGKYYLAEALYDKVLPEGEKHIIKHVQGRDLEHIEYEALFDYANSIIKSQGQKAHFIVCDDYVTLSDGTGIVHIAPAFGDDDNRVGRKYSLPFVQLVTETGTMPEEVYDAAGVFCKDADKLIIKKLKAERKLFKTAVHEHSYPFCWRCDTPLIYYARHSWYIEMSKLRDKLCFNNNKVNWIPANIGEGRFGNFIANAVDWALSRERYWGTPLPVWVCEECKKIHVVGSVAELKEMAVSCSDDIELHRPYIDKIDLVCPHCQALMKRVPEVIDCWFDSGSMPFAQYHYPFENKEKFEANYPAQYISEALDQTRGWFYSLMAISSLVFNKNPYENVIVLGLVQDKNGQKMSKHKGNVVDPWDILDKQGSDAVRWYFYTNSNPWLPSRFSEDAVSEGQRRFMATLWNTYAFYIMYAKIDEFNPLKYNLEYSNLNKMDKWILSRLQTLIQFVDRSLEKYDITAAARALADFTDELSNWYVRRGRSRYWLKDMPQDKLNAYLTLYTVLENLVRLSSVFVPFISDEIYQNLVRTVDNTAPESVHLCAWPQCRQEWILPELEQEMADLLKTVSLGRACRNEANIKNRQPLGEILLNIPRKLPADLAAELLDELNIKTLRYLDDSSNLLSYSVKPQLRILGKKLGSKLNSVREALSKIDGAKAVSELKKNALLSLVIDEEVFEFTEEELIIETVQADNYYAKSEKDFTVAIDVRLDENLLSEGFMREIISKIQTMRKDAAYEVEDRIKIYYNAGDLLQGVILKHSCKIQDETLAVDIVLETNADKLKKYLSITDTSYYKKWSINGEDCEFVIYKSN